MDLVCLIISSQGVHYQVDAEPVCHLAPALTTLDGGGPAAGAAKDPFFGMRLRGAPPAIVLVPDGDALLAEQVAGTAYALLGGYARASRSWTPGASDSLFRYRGPKVLQP